MANLKRILPVIFLFLSACGSYTGTITPRPLSLTVPFMDTPGALSQTPADQLTDTPEVTGPPSGNCYFVESRQELPELSQKVNQVLQAMASNAAGRAYAYGEDCVYEDGTRVFHAMETDFPVQIQVENIHDEKALGDWVYKVMQALQELPPDQVPGGQPGRVEFQFIQGKSETLSLIVQIGRYQREAGSLKGAELFQFFSQNH